MKKLQAYSLIALGALMFLAAIVVTLYIRFTNIDATEMRIFVDYWWIHLLVAVTAFFGFKIFLRGLIKL